VAGDTELQGIIPNSFEHIFNAIQGSANKQYLVRASFLEIYNEEIRDLLSKSPKDKLELREHKDSGVYVKGLNAFVVKSVAEMRNVLEVRRGDGPCSMRRLGRRRRRSLPAACGGVGPGRQDHAPP
jgi:kinesin family protein 3/17